MLAQGGGSLLETHKRFVTVLDLVKPECLVGRRPLPSSQTCHLIDRLDVDPTLRRLCEDPERGSVCCGRLPGSRGSVFRRGCTG